MSELEDRLRAAMAARAEAIGPADLSPAGPPPASAGRPRLIVLAGAGLAAAATVLTVTTLIGLGRPTPTSPPVAAASSPAVSSVASSPSSVARSLPATPAPTTPAEVAVCRPSDLTPFVLPDSAARAHDAGMNHRGATIGLTNVGSTPCRIYGYLGVALSSQGRQVSVDPSTRGDVWFADDPGTTTIVLGPGRSAYCEVAWTSADGEQPAVATDTLQVILPDQREPLEISYPSVVGGDRRLGVTALAATPSPLK